MYDRSIPFFNTILRCDHYTQRPVILSPEYTIVPYRCGFEKGWGVLEYALGDFDSPKSAEQYFTKTYLQDQSHYDDLLFLINSADEVIGSVLTWQDSKDDREVSSLHWLCLEPQHQGQGLGKALCCAAMNRYERLKRLPVYIHTQPWSWKAILLYQSLGFRLQYSDSFSHYPNETRLAMQELKKILSSEKYSLLENSSAP